MCVCSSKAELSLFSTICCRGYVCSKVYYVQIVVCLISTGMADAGPGIGIMRRHYYPCLVWMIWLASFHVLYVVLGCLW
jgi:hypothetical protein